MDKNALYIGVDIAKRLHVAMAGWVDEGGELVETGPCALTNDATGYAALLKWAQATAAGRTIVFGMEPTGHYYLLLARHLFALGFDVRIISGLEVKRARELWTRSRHKTDHLDARAIVWALSIRKGKPFAVAEDAFAGLRTLKRVYDKMLSDNGRAAARVRRCLDTLWPEFDAVLNVRAMSHFELLTLCQGPDQVAALGREGLHRLFPKLTPVALDKILAVSTGSIGEYREYVALELRHQAAAVLRAFEGQQAVLKEAARLMASVPYTESLLAIPGVGMITLFLFLGEVGDLRKYPTSNQLLKMCGINLITQSSGEVHGRPRISREGHKGARTTLYYLAVNAARREHFLHPYFRALIYRGNGTKPALIAVARKLVRIFHALARKNEPFCYQKRVAA